MLAVLLLIASALATTIPVVNLTGGVNPGSANYLVEAIHDAEADGAPAIVIELDTPGGLVTSAREIVQAELSSTVPIVVYVQPSGARAGSAGVFLTMAGHVAAMAPGTTIGAAHPVDLFGGMGGGEEESEEEAESRAVMEEKILQDTSAWARAIAEQRGRNVEWMELAVRESASVTDREALELGVVDLIAPSLDELLEQIDGMEVQTPDGPVVLHTAGAEIERVPMSLRQTVLLYLGDPTLLFALIALGMLGLYTEFHNPGLVFPGAIGVLALVGAGIGLSILPFNAGGLIMVILGFGMFALEVYTPTFGGLTAAGVAALGLGGVLLFEVDGFDLRIDPAFLITVAVGTGLVTLALAWLIARDFREKPSTGAEGLVGMRGEVLIGGDGKGRIRVHGEDWRATWSGRLETGATVLVDQVDGLTLRVRSDG